MKKGYLSSLLLLCPMIINAAAPQPVSKAPSPPVPTPPADIKQETVHGSWESKSPGHLSHSGWFFSADFLYWRADEFGLEYGFDIHKLRGSSNISAPGKEKSVFPEISWDPGFRLGTGYNFGFYDSWDLNLKWTHFNTHHDDRTVSDSPTDHSIQSTWAPILLGQVVWKATVDWNLQYNVYDLELGRNYFVSQTLALRPLVGVRGATLHQHYKTDCFIFDNSGLVPLDQFARMKAKNNFWGVGARLGSELLWHFTHHWSVLGQCSGSLLYGKFDVEQKINGLIPGLTPTPTTDILHDRFSRTAANLEAGLGIQWETFYHRDKYHVALTASYEFSSWFDQNQMQQLITVPLGPNSSVISEVRREGRLSVQGATFSARFDF